jgi:predicted DCC family thiol-disulfide oxidoreductase YuxK
MSAVLLFDGVCNLCSGTVQFVIAHDPNGYFQFASQQSEAGQALMREHGIAIPEGDPLSLVLVEDGKVYQRSTGALRLCRKLSFPFKLGWVFIITPRFVRDFVYDVIAKHRYAWFGKNDVCMVPTPELRARFLG